MDYGHSYIGAQEPLKSLMNMIIMIYDAFPIAIFKCNKVNI